MFLRRTVKLLAVSVLLIAVLIGVIEAWRQWTIAEARAERNEALDRINAHFADVKDFGPWFDSQVKGSHGGPALSKAAAEFKATEDWISATNLPWHDTCAAVMEGRVARQHPDANSVVMEFAPDAEAWHQFLVVTANHARVIEELTKHDHLHVAPAVGIPERNAIMADFEAFPLLRLHYARAGALLYVGQPREAVREALVALKINNRMMRPQCYGQAASAEAMAGFGYRVLMAVLMTQALGIEELEALRAECDPVADYASDVLRGDLALIAGRHREGTYEYHYTSCVTYEGLFGWLVDARLDLRERHKRYFEGAPAVYRHEREYLDAQLELMRGIESGKATPRSRGGANGADEVNLYREHSRALLEIRLREAWGAPFGDIAANLKGYDALDITDTGNGIAVGFKPTERASRALRTQTASGVPAQYPPVVLRPLK